MGDSKSPLRYRVFGIGVGVTGMMLLLMALAWLDPYPNLFGMTQRAAFYVESLILWPVFLVIGALGGAVFGIWLYRKIHPESDEDVSDVDEADGLFARLWDQR